MKFLLTLSLIAVAIGSVGCAARDPNDRSKWTSNDVAAYKRVINRETGVMQAKPTILWEVTKLEEAPEMSTKPAPKRGPRSANCFNAERTRIEICD